MAKKGPKNPLTDQHKAAMAAGRTEGRAVREYLDALRSNKPKRGRKRTPDSIKARLVKIEAEIEVADALEELRLIQERRDLAKELANMGASVDMTGLEAEFVKVAKAYSARHGISYASWRDVGVDPKVLAAAGISRTD
jgi:uncharacterized protein YicC (UPF0701 family)